MVTNDSTVTKVTKQDLINFQNYIRKVLADLDTLQRTGHNTDPLGDRDIPPVDGALGVLAGGPKFGPAQRLVGKVKSMGASVADQITWLRDIFRSMDFELTETIAAFEANEDVNSMTVEQFLSHFPNTIGAMGSPQPGSNPQQPVH